MYGLILEGVAVTIREKYGEEAWEQIRKIAEVNCSHFRAHKRYSETVVSRIVSAAVEYTGDTNDVLMKLCGNVFVSYVDNYGYNRIMSVLGRQLRDFLNGLDNLHEYLRFTYPRLKPPSFFCSDESANGLTLHYRSRRRGFVHYVIGQIQAVALRYYKTRVAIEVLSQEEVLDLTNVKMRLMFDNSAYEESQSESIAKMSETNDKLAIQSDIFFEVFPFHILFDRQMVIKNVGTGLTTVIPKLLGRFVDEMFVLVRPMVEFNVDNLTMYINNIFEIESVDSVSKLHNASHLKNGSDTMEVSDDDDDRKQRFRLKGQMLMLDTNDLIIFLATPIIENISSLFDAGLYINDLSMHDSSRDLVLAGTQQSAELKLALDQEQKKSKVLEESMQQLDIEMKRTDSLLYQMIPRTVADRLRTGEPAVDTCEVFEQVTILFSDVVGFTSICSQITPMAVVSMLNNMYTAFDTLSEKNKVYKVETIGDAYMVVSGAPTVTIYHALYVSDMALDMMDAMKDLIEPSSGKHMRIRVGLHSGTVVAGVVGMKMPRYCLFGNTVNTASKMECNGEAMKINISETTKGHLESFGYPTVEHGTIEVMGNETLRTYWLTGRSKSDNKFLGMTAADENNGAAAEEESVENSPASSCENIQEKAVESSVQNGRVQKRASKKPCKG